MEARAVRGASLMLQAALPLIIGGCSAKPETQGMGSCVPAPELVIAARSLGPASVRILRNGGSEDPGLSCELKVLGGWVGAIAASSPIGMTFVAHCLGSEGERAVDLSFDLGDIRGLPMGAHGISPTPCGDQRGDPSGVWWATWLDAARFNQYCCFDVPVGGAVLTVERAAGAAAPYPEVLAADYDRVFRIDVTVPNTRWDSWGWGTARDCTGSIQLTLSARFELTPENVTVDPAAQECGG